MRAIIGLILLTTSFSTLGQTYNGMIEEIRADTTRARQRFEYIKRVRPNDTLCANAIRRAEIQAKDTLCFIIWNGPFGLPLRYENELNELSKKHGLKFDYELGSCTVFENQTLGCYKDYMDKKVYEKFGKDFKETLHVRADSLFLVNHINDTIRSWDCDKGPSFMNKRIDPDGINVIVDLHNERTQKGVPMFDGDRQFIDVSFVVDKQGDLSKFKLAEFYPPREIKEGELRLLEIATKEIKKNYPKWTPGEINRVRLNTTYVLRVRFNSAT